MSIFTMSAIDPDCGVNALVNYTLGDSAGRGQFSISADSGELCVSAPLDHELSAEYEFPVVATDRGGLSTTAMVKIQLLDINDNVPAFTTRDNSVSLKEGRISSAEPIVAVSAADADGGRYGAVTYRIINGNDNDVFRIDRATGEIFVTKPALIQANSKFELEVSATDGGGLSAPQSARVRVNVMPAGVGSVFDKPRYNFRVREDVRSGTVVGNLKPASNERGKQSVRYSIVSGDFDRHFTIEPMTGSIRTSSQLDREIKASYLLNVQAATGNSQNYDQTQVSIIVEDVNDNAPEFTSAMPVRVSVAESTAIGSVVYAARATDVDEGKNGQLTYALLSASGPPNTFGVNSQHGLVTLLRPLDYENLVKHTLLITVKDNGTPSLSANLTLVVDVQDVNDNAPVFEHDSYNANILESEAVNTKILEIQAIDKDTGNNARITYRIVPENNTIDDFFGVHPNTGWVYLAKQLDRETSSVHKMTLTATDNGIPPLSATARLVINVIDANDNDPIFSKASYEFKVEENKEAGAVVGRISAKDADLGDNAALRYSLFPTNTSFNVNPVTGVITTKERLDREFKASYAVFAEAKDQGTPARSSRVPVLIQITDVNDNSPEIIDPREDVVSVREEQQPGAEVARVKAIDRDNGVNSSLTYSILNERDSDGFGVFVIDSKTGVIKTSTVLDHEERSIYRLTVAATDGGKPPRQTVRQLKVEVLDLNDNRPTFTSSSLSFKVKEDAIIGHIVGAVACCDSDIQENLVNGDNEKHISYLLMPITSDHHPGTFEIDRRTGSLVVARQLDREMQDEYRLEVRALDTSSTNNPQSSAVTVKIEIIDVNDNAPQWAEDPITIKISEVTPLGSIVYNFTASDADTGSNGELNYEITSSLPAKSPVFTIDPLTGSLTLTSHLDYESLKEYWLTVRATDMAPNVVERQSSAATVHIIVTDANDNAPIFVSAAKASVSLNTLTGTIYQALAVDADSGENGKVSYSISNSKNDAYFTMEHDTGKLLLSKKVSSETSKVKPGLYKLNLTASDHGSPFPRMSHMLLSLNLLESTNVPPRFTQAFYKANISEDIRPGSFVTRVSAKSSRGENGNLTYFIPTGVADGKFTIEEKRGTIFVTSKIDREQKDTYVVPVYVTDSSTFQSSNFDVTIVTINVLDVNDNPPSFKQGSCYPLSVPENNDLGVIHTVTATDNDIGANALITYSIISGNNGNRFYIDPSSGQLSARTLDRETQSKYYLTITAYDHGNPIALQKSCNLTVIVEDQNDNDPVFDTGHYSAMIPEDAAIDTSVIKVRATDADLGFNKRIVYSLANESQGLFRIDNKSGIIFTTGNFDREKRDKYHFEAVATDEGRYIARSQRVSVEVSINDVNDNKPIFTKYPFAEQVATLTPPGQSLLKVQATDTDIGTNSEILYELVDISNHKFRINPTTGVLTATQSLASENGKLIHLKVLAKDKDNPPQSSIGLIEIRVGDFSDQTPMLHFQNATYNISIPENLYYGKEVMQVTAVRSDGRRQRIIYEFGSGNDQYAFDIDSNTGVIRVNNSANLDYESFPGPKRKFVVVARTEGSPVLYGYSEITVNLLDQNDNAPRFTQQQYIANVLEGNTKGEFVVQLSAKDSDQGANARILYHIVDGNHDNAFIIEPAFSGSVKTNIVLDREIRETYKLTVIATDEGDPQMTGTATLRINVVDINDNQPTFPPPNVISVSEGTAVGTVLTSVTANDVDTYPALQYIITKGDDKFSIDRYSGKVVLNGPLDYESETIYHINVTASDSEHIAQTTLTVKVTDVNDHDPEFDENSYYRVLPEGSGVQEIGSLSAKDKDSEDNGKISFSLLHPVKGYFIDATSGVIYVNYSSLPEKHRDTQLAVVATDHGKPNRSAVAAVKISAGASSEIKPFIGQDTYRITVNEDMEKGSSLLQIGGINDIVKKYNLEFHIISGNEAESFDVSSDGALLLVKKLDRETQDSFVLGLAAVEQGKVLSYNQNKTSITIFVTVADSNDNAPVFLSKDFELTVSEDVKIGYTLIQMSATDSDLYGTPNSAITYNITSGDDKGLFYIEPRTGVITVNKTLDYDTSNIQYKLIIIACDQGLPALCNAAYIKLEIIDENDNTPTFPVTEYFETIAENERVGTSVFTARATDLDRGRYGKLNYSISSSSHNRNDDSWKMFQIDSSSGLVNTNAVFDYEQKNKYEFSIKASDIGGKSSTVKVRIDIESRDEFYPQFTQKTYNFPVPKTGALPSGYTIGRVTATDRDKGIDGRIVYQLSTSHSYFKINRTTGVIIVKKKADSVETLFGYDKSISLVVTASSGRQGSLTNKTAVEISLDPLGVIVEVPPEGNAAVAANGGLSDWALGLLICFIFIIIIFAAAFLFLHIKNKRHKKVNKPGLNSEGVGATNSYVDPSAFDTIPIRNTAPGASQFAPPRYDEIPPYGPHTASSNSGAATTSELSGSDQSGSSGRGSAEDGEDGEDEEIRMINEGPLQRDSLHRQNNGVEDDNLSDVSVHNTQEYLARLGIVDTGAGGGASTSSRRCSENVTNKDPILHHGTIDPIHMFDEDAAHENDITNLIYAKLNEVTGSERASSADEASAAVDRAMALGAFPSAPGENTAVPTQGPSMTGSLSSIVHSEEELTGSYNWDYLLDWGPQYQPLAHVFSEIARLKDDAVSLQSANSAASSAKSKGTSLPGGKSVPPPLLTTVAPRSCPAPSLSCRQPQHLLPRSPISHDVPGGFSAAAAMSPSFSPSLSPLATRSPSMSPLVGPGLPPIPANRKSAHSTLRL
ncbi:hypothetical protein JYU34_008455 [Plutella xylostella]|uniref:Cadherin domain-containing protein n=1 Tax=Plutella xylostella TaxID=51655 RepID=A0ABQ7QN06_PLUXY|nr:hypothetical protein JYU34_008455 [Plutella xylostella]